MIIYGLILLAYLFGSIASAVIVCRISGLSDPRAAGSKNPGATNVLRLHGKKAAALTLIGDVLKGAIPVYFAHFLEANSLIIALTGLAAFCGHLYPVFFGFKGGKGVATFIGVLFATHWLLGLAFVSTWLIMAFLFRYSSLSALTATLLIPFFSLWLIPAPEIAISNSIMAILLFWRHRSNIKNLLNHEEEKLDKRGD